MQVNISFYWKQLHYIFAMFSKMLLNLGFRCTTIAPPSIDITRYLNQAPGWEEDCSKVAKLMHEVGLLYAFDPRVDHAKNNAFLDQMEEYFEVRSKQYERGIKNLDVSTDGDLPVGLKFIYNQKLQAYLEERKELKLPNLPLTPEEPEADPTWRYHWLLNQSTNLVPHDFPNFSEIMQAWGLHLFGTGMTIAEMTAIGLGLDPKAISMTIENGSLYLSPPAVDLTKTKPGETITGFHRDFSLFTVHGKCRYSGLYAWLLTREKFLVKMPDRHLLVQGGKQLEWITGGYIRAGFHEVIHNQLVEEQKQKNIKQGKKVWRVASTLFCHVQGNLSMKPFDRFRSPEVDKVYPDITADQYLMGDYKESTTNTQ